MLESFLSVFELGHVQWTLDNFRRPKKKTKRYKFRRAFKKKGGHARTCTLHAKSPAKRGRQTRRRRVGSCRSRRRVGSCRSGGRHSAHGMSIVMAGIYSSFSANRGGRRRPWLRDHSNFCVFYLKFSAIHEGSGLRFPTNDPFLLYM